jgi:hypothetical protein
MDEQNMLDYSASALWCLPRCLPEDVEERKKFLIQQSKLNKETSLFMQNHTSTMRAFVKGIFDEVDHMGKGHHFSVSLGSKNKTVWDNNWDEKTLKTSFFLHFEHNAPENDPSWIYCISQTHMDLSIQPMIFKLSHMDSHPKLGSQNLEKIPKKEASWFLLKTFHKSEWEYSLEDSEILHQILECVDLYYDFRHFGKFRNYEKIANNVVDPLCSTCFYKIKEDHWFEDIQQIIDEYNKNVEKYFKIPFDKRSTPNLFRVTINWMICFEDPNWKVKGRKTAKELRSQLNKGSRLSVIKESDTRINLKHCSNIRTNQVGKIDKFTKHMSQEDKRKEFQRVVSERANSGTQNKEHISKTKKPLVEKKVVRGRKRKGVDVDVDPKQIKISNFFVTQPTNIK